MDNLTRNVVAEAVGTFMLVFVTVTVVAVGPGIIPAALAYGLGTAALIAALGHVSGGHFNPAITLAMLLSKRIDTLAAVAYWIAQLAGAAAGALVVMLSSERDVVRAGTPVIADDLVSVGGAIAVEAAATMILVLVYLGTVVDQYAPASVYPLASGLTIAGGFFAIAPLTGGAINPARGFGPSVVSGEWDGLAAWLAGPLVGAVIAWALYQFVVAPNRAESGAGRRTRSSRPLPPPPGSSLLP
ncbi:MIP/aquaporin family protein [Jiangella anatolica]|uniref:Aquaporin n=1 Tax=Jiangella anatolica TaxID=2670374 RepID=A0A2W2BNH8_9ACTN|nr:aquaporin [Jiangella anatolica]PZF81758.1 aquaporin [Jiangella anatolica]